MSSNSSNEVKNAEWRIDRDRKILAFKSPFMGRKATLKHWNITGYYQSQVTSDGHHALHMFTRLKAPVPLTKGKLNQTWSLSSDQNGVEKDSVSEMFSCTWTEGPYKATSEKAWHCFTGMSKIPLVKWFNKPFGQTVPFNKVSQPLFRLKYGNVAKNMMLMRATRSYLQPEEKLSWKLGTRKNYFIKFIHQTDDKITFGHTKALRLNLIEPPLIPQSSGSNIILSPMVLGSFAIGACVILLASIIVSIFFICETKRTKKKMLTETAPMVV